MSLKYPVPDEAQAKLLEAHGMDPHKYMVVHEEKGECLRVKHYQSGDEISIYPNALKRRT